MFGVKYILFLPCRERVRLPTVERGECAGSFLKYIYLKMPEVLFESLKIFIPEDLDRSRRDLSESSGIKIPINAFYFTKCNSCCVLKLNKNPEKIASLF